MNLHTTKSPAIRPPPPPSLCKEDLGVWTGWCFKGDREVAREAAVKGHVQLVTIFISVRRKISQKDAEEFFKQEVLLWADELLSRKQIFRVTHILNNISLDPSLELEKIFYRTTKRDLREYIGNHLEKISKLSDHLKQLWNFLEIILSNSVLMIKSKLDEDSIECLDKQPDQWKYEIAGKLLFFSHVPPTDLTNFLNGEVLWRQLLSYDNMKLIKAWIKINFNNSADQSLNVSEDIQCILESLPITAEMINEVSECKCSVTTKEIVLNELARFGIFCNSDKQDLLSVLDRTNQSVKILNIYRILNCSFTNISLNGFAKLVTEYCLENKLYNVLNIMLKDCSLSELLNNTKSSHLLILQDFRSLAKNNFNEQSLYENILKVAKFLSEDSVAYFNENLLIFLALLFFSRDVCFLDILKNNFVQINNEEFSSVVTNVVKKFNLLRNIYKKKLTGVKHNLSYYDLVQTHLKIDVKQLFASHLGSKETLNFSSAELVSKYGYTKKTNYLFYLKQYRPSISSKIFLVTQLQKYGKIHPDDLQTVRKKVYRTALGYFESQEITSSCVAFLEMIGVNSDFLKVSVKAANILLNSGIDANEIKTLFLNIENDPYAIQQLLESSVMSQIDSFVEFDSQEFVNAIKAYEVVVKFSFLYNLTLPELFLKHCAHHNQWLPFLIFAQLKNYPISQIKATLQHLKNSNLLEHLTHSIIHDIQVEEQNVLMRERDSRKYFLSKIGVRKTVDNISQNSDSLYSLSYSSVSLGSSTGSSSGSEFLEIDISNVKATLLQTLIRCHNSTDPPKALLQACQLYRNPLLAVLATSYEPDSVITNWLTWLAVSTDLYQIFTNFESIATNAQAVTNLLNDCMKHKYPKTLFQGFEIFIPVNPVNIFVQFLNLLIDRQYDNQILTSKLDAFRNANSSRKDSVISDSDFEMTYLNNRLWIENTSLQLLASTIEYNFNSLHEKIEIVKLLYDLKLEGYFTTTCSSLNKLLDILKNIWNAHTSVVKLDICLYFDVKIQSQAVVNCVNECLGQELYEIALNVAKISDLPEELIAIKMWQHKFENRDGTEKNFWADCNACLSEHHVNPESVIEFYLSCVNEVRNASEKYELYCLSQGWARKNGLPNQYELETHKWLAYVNLDENWKRSRDIIIENWQPEYLSYKEMMDLVANIHKYDKNLPEACFTQLDIIALESLNRGNFLLSLKLEKMFGCRSGDLDIIKLCYSLAEGLVMPYQLSDEQNLLLSRNRQFRRFRSISGQASTGSYVSGSSYGHVSEDTDTVQTQDTLTLLHCLTEKLSHGSKLAYSIFMMYRISINIELPYQVVASNTDHLKMLKDALGDDCFNKLEVVHDFIHVHKWPKEIITDFVCEEVVSAASNFVKSNSEKFILWDINVDQQFHLVLQLLHDNCSLLGQKIYSYASALHQVQLSADLNFKISELALIIELLVIAHSCFTTDCNMEGISTILKKCQTVISHLLTLRSWKLIVRLLTGVGRYTEMNYVFQILKENDQFEFLLRKGSRRDSRLKVALLEYLKKYCPDNRELYRIVALHFTLFSEVAFLWERESQSVIRNLIAISKLEMQNKGINLDAQLFVLFSNSDGTRLCLNKAIENYTYAAEFHLQGEKLAKAMHSAKQAELIALQMSLLKGSTNNTAFCLLNLNNGQINYLISTQLNFHQAHILVQAYNYQADWAFVLYEQCILKTDTEYLDAFLENLCLTDTLVHDISRKFLTANINTPDEIKNMKHLLNKLPSVHTKYRLASELGFTDLVEDLITKGQLAYLKDTVWKKGYKD